MVEVRGLVKEFDGFRALDGANMNVKRGAIYGLVGPNGAGKSTLLRHLTGVYRQNAGTVKIALMAILCHICSQRHGSLHVYSLIGGPVPGSFGDLAC